MEAVIKVKPDELKPALIDLLAGLVKVDDNIEILIQLRRKSTSTEWQEDPAEYMAQLQRSQADRSNGRTISFTAGELEQYVRENFSE